MDGADCSMNPLLQRLRKEKGRGNAPRPSFYSSEAHRIIDIPMRVPTEGLDLTEDLKTSNGTMSLRSVQSQALEAVREMQGGFFPIGVGHGKSLIALLSGTVLNARCVIVFVPASTVSTMVKTYQDFSYHFRMPENIHILSYAKLSRPEGTALLDKLRGDIPARDVLIVCDEVHRLKRLEASRTKRVIRWFKENEDAKFVGLSGTITSKSLRDFSHLIALALRQGSPLPLKKDELDLWAITLDVPNWTTDSKKRKIQRQGFNYNRKSIEALAPLEKWAVTHGVKRPDPVSEPSSHANALVRAFQRVSVDDTRKKKVEFMRKAFGLRLRTTPGVIATKETSVPISLYIRKKSPDIPDDIRESLLEAADSDQTPSEEVFDSEISKWRCLRQLSWGYYLEWDWGDEGPDNDWLIARAGWRRSLYQELMYRSDQGYDSPLLVTRKIQRDVENGVGSRDIHYNWRLWDTQRHKPVPPTVAHWINKSLFSDTLAAISGRAKPTAIWCDSSEMQDEARRQGYAVYGAGQEIPDHPHTAVLSISAHGIGKNLVQWSQASVLTWQSDGQMTEQLLGRHHRPGQSADEVWVDVYAHTPVFDKAFVDSKIKANYIETLTGNKQKILLATTL